MAKVQIDGRTYEVDASRNLLDVCLSLGLNLPYFCWHPALGSVGACRQCAVKQYRDENDTRGRIVMACMTPAADNTRIAIDEQDARAFRASVTEWLMVNHPHDCPICDEGGECHLQDMTVMSGHTYREFRFKKRTYTNQDLGPFINHEMNRCIQCYRCVRFYRDYAGGRDLQAFAAHDHVYFGRHQDGALESEFSGNLVEVCPTGVFTDKSFKQHFTRKWDLRTAPSICVHCSLGCNIVPGERYGRLRRIRARYNGAVNGYFLCDRGRYGYEFVNQERRIRQAILPRGSERPAQAAGKDEALQRLAPLVSDPTTVIGIGSPRASLESNFALMTLVGPERFYQGVGAAETQLVGRVIEILRDGPARTPSLREVESCDAVLVLGEDATNTSPMLALALRQSVRQRPMQIAAKLRIPLWQDEAVREAIQQERGPLFIATPDATGLDDIARRTFRGAVEGIARLGYAVARAIDPEAPGPDKLPETEDSLATEIARALQEAERPLVVSGTGAASAAIVEAAANVAWALRRTGKEAGLFLAVPECNSLGTALLGGDSLDAALEAASGSQVRTVVILENDLYRRAAAERVDRLLSGDRRVIVIDHIAHGTAARAEVVLPAGTFAETDGTLVNNEGRAQRFFQVFVPEGDTQESWRWIRDAMRAAGRPEGEAWQALDDITAALAGRVTIFRDLPRVAPDADLRLAGARVPRAPHRQSGRTAVRAHLSVHEPKPPVDADSPLSFTMEGYEGPAPAALTSHFWAPGWNSIQSLNKFQDEISGPLRGGDPGLRLLEPSSGPGPAYFKDAPGSFHPRKDEWRVVVETHIFGSEELSRLAPAVAQRTPIPRLGLHPDDAADLGVREGEEVSFDLGGRRHRLPLRLRPQLPRGIVALPLGLGDLETGPPPEWIRITGEANR